MSRAFLVGRSASKQEFLDVVAVAKAIEFATG
jgi:hypothetical protein